MAGAMRRPAVLADTLERLARAGSTISIAATWPTRSPPTSRKSAVPSRARICGATSQDAQAFVAASGDRVLYNSPPRPGPRLVAHLGVFERLGVKRRDSFEHIHGLMRRANARWRSAIASAPIMASCATIRARC